MSVLYPSLITGPLLLLIGVPVLIHLIHLLRHRRVKWAAMEFLLASQKKNRKSIILKQLLLLLLRTGTVAALLVTLAQPVLRSAWGRLLVGAKTHHVVLLDDSFSMSDHGQEGSAFALGKRFVQQLADKLGQQEGTHTLSLLRFSQAGEPSGADSFDFVREPVDSALHARLEQSLADANTSQTAAGPAEPLRTVARLSAEANDETRIVYIVSDFRSNEWGDAGELRDILARMEKAGAGIHLVGCVKTTRDNLAVTSLRPTAGTAAADVEMLLRVSVRNFGTTAARRVVVRLEQDGRARPAVVLDEIAPGATATGHFRVRFPTAGYHKVAAALAPDAVSADNTRYLALDLPDALPVLLIDTAREARDAHFLALALAPGGSVRTGLRPRVETPDFLRKHDRLSEFAAIYLLNLDRLEDAEIDAVEAYAGAGGGVAFFLGERASAPFYNDKLYRNGDGIFPVPLTFPTDLLVNRLDKTPDLVVTDHPVFSVFTGQRNTFLDNLLVERYFAVPAAWAPAAEASTRVIARLRNGAPLIVEKVFGEGRVVAVLTKAAPEGGTLGRWNNWAQNNPSFVVAMLELQGYLARRRLGPTERSVGQPLTVALDPQQHNRRVRFKIPGGDASESLLVEARPDGKSLTAVLTDTGASGVYETQLGHRDGTLQRHLYAYNVVAREGDLRRVGEDELAAQLKGIHCTFHHASELAHGAEALAGFHLRDVLLPLLLLLLLAEQVVAYSAGYHRAAEGAGR